MIQNACEKSDKTNLEYLELPKEFIDISNELSAISNDNSRSIIDGKTYLSQEYLARLQLLEPYLRMEVYLYQKDLLLSSNSNINTDWFNEINDFLTNTYDKYKNESFFLFLASNISLNDFLNIPILAVHLSMSLSNVLNIVL